ncbi:MAG TPA: RHS repeat-associated core domain-containing protein [Thermoanaerobaculia bacterium]|nr:RHS repeat-associated core domain-containing protein [Thermoanaerobaculia bacterium]
MSHRPVVGRAALLAVALVLQTLLAAVPVPMIAAAKTDASVTQTGKHLPSAAERLDGTEPRDEEPFRELAPDEQTGAPRADGTFELPPGYKENPDRTPPAASMGDPYKAERRAGGRKDGGVELLRLDVSGDITANTTWALVDSPIVVSGTVNVVAPAVLTIEPAVVVKFEAAATLVVKEGATLNAVGTASDRIVFTSMKDDTVGGDTNGDGSATTPAAGDWGDLSYPGWKSGSIVTPSLGSLQFADVRYGDDLYVRYSKPTLTDLTVTDMASAGLYLEAPANTTYAIERLTLQRNRWNVWLYAVPANTTIKDSIIRESQETAVIAQSSTAARLTNNAIDHNGTGTMSWAITASSSPMVLRYNTIASNRRSNGSSYGVSASGSTVDAQYNWWGSTTGPAVEFAADTGGGSTISATGVTYTNWLGKAFEPDHKRGNFPWTAKAGVGADVASGNFFYADADVSIPTIGFPLEVRRTYNNQAATVAGGDFGAGWAWTFGQSLNVAADAYGGVTWEQADGAKNYFKKNPDNSFTPEDGIYSRLTYDAGASEYTLTHKDQTRFVFNSAGKLTTQIDTDGNATVIARDGAGKIQTVTEPTGRQLTVTYNAGGQISRIVDPLGRTFDYTYTGSPATLATVTRKESTTGPTYASCSYQYTSYAYQLTTVNDCEGNKLVLTYDTTKRVKTSRWNESNTVRFTYGPGTDSPSGLTFAAGSTGVFDERGRANVFFYTKGNKVFEKWREKQILGGTYYWYTEHLWTYVGYLATSYRDIENRVTTTAFDWESGNLLEEVLPGNRETTHTYDAFNNPTSTTDNLSRVTEFAYDGEQHLVTITDPLDHETTTTYTTAGLPETVTDARGKVTSFTYDQYGYPATVTNAESETLTFSYDAGGWKLWEETPQSERTTYTYNARDQVLTVTDPLTHVTTTTYDAKGRKATVTDAEGEVTTYTYNDLKNLLWKTTDAKNGVVEFTYDAFGPNLASVKDALTRVTSFLYDDFNRRTQETDPNSKLTTWEYTYGGHLAKTTDALNGTATYTYATNGDLSSIAYSDSLSVSFTYDGVGNRLTMTDWVGTHSWVYDDLNRITSATDGAGNVIGYGYDAVGNLTTITYPGSKTVTYAFDDANRIASVTDWDSRVTPYTYDASGRLGSFTLPNGVVTTYGYDDASRTTSVSHLKDAATVAARSYTLDDVGNRLTSTRGAASDTYVYDELYRITGVTYADGTAQSFTYDATGNRSSQTYDGLATTYSYDPADQLLNAGDGLRAYDHNGQLTKIGSHRGFSWDVRGKLTQVTNAPANTAPVANAGPDQAAYVDRLVILDGSASSDAEGEPLTYAWIEDGTNPATGILHGTASPRPGFTTPTAGTYTFQLTVSDGRTSSAVDAVTVTVQAGAPPTQVLSSTAAAAASGFVTSTSPTGRSFSNDVRAGKNGLNEYRGAAQFLLPAVPAETYLSAATLDLMGKSNSNNNASDEWSVDLLPTSVDANWNTTASWNTIGTVTPDTTLAPTLVGLNQVVANSLDSWTFGGADLTALTSRLAGSGKLSIRTKGVVTPTIDYVNWYGGNATTATNRPKLTLTFSATAQYDHAPVARAGLDQTAVKGAQVTLHGEDSYDYEDASVTHAWTQLAGPAVTLSSATAASPTFTPTVAGTYRFRDTVSDSASQTAQDDVVITVLTEAPPAVTSYTYDGDSDRMSQTADGVTTSYVVNSVPKLEAVLLETTGSSTTYYVYGHDLLYTVKADGPHYHHADSLGSTIAVTDGSGTVEQTMDYDVFGRLRSSTGANGTTYTFTAEENDPSGFVYLRARYYDPATGRFLSRDPYPADAQDTQTINRYVYVKNNPTNYVDPSGQLAVLTPSDWGWLLQFRTHMNLALPGEFELSDALRHSISSKRAAEHLGVAKARQAGLLNEYFKYNAALTTGDKILMNSTLMDVWNNEVGLRAAASRTPIDWRDLLVMDKDGTLRAPTRDDYERFQHQYPDEFKEFSKYDFRP